MLHDWMTLWFGWVQDWGYGGVIVLMAMESSIFPVPSELVIPPAAFLAAQGSGNIYGVVAAGTFGSWLGSAITYGVARWLGRPFVLRFGHLFFCPPSKLERAERFVERYEAGSVFFARLLPVIRHLISIPAGIVRMSFLKFSALTTVGAAIWCSVLAWYGHGLALRNPDLMSDPTALVAAVKHESLWLIAAIALLGGLYFVMLRLTAPNAGTLAP